MKAERGDFYQSAYALQFFDFTPEQVSAERKHLVHSLIDKAIDVTIKKLQTPATSALLAQQKDIVTLRMKKACNKRLIPLHNLDIQTFRIPQNVLLTPDFDLDNKYTKEDEQKKTAKLEELKLQFRENMTMLAELKSENDKYAAIEDIIQHELQMHQQVLEACASFKFNQLRKFINRIFNDVESRN